jgi:DNA-binding Lrp family transcriptional regulator
LGSRSQIRDAYEIFKNTYVNDKQQFLEGIFNNLAKQRGVTTEITIKPVEPISYEFSESIVAQFAPKEWILEKIGVDMSKYQPEIVNPTTAPEPTQAMINEHLKGMKGREWQNFQRIIREYNKGKITREQASQMLKSAYGLGEEELATWLGAEEFSDDIDTIIQVFSEYGEHTDNYKTLATRQVFGKDLEQEELAFRDEVVDDTLDKKILDVISKNKGIRDEDIAKAVKEDLVVVQERINKLKELEILKIDSKGIKSLTKPLSEIIDKPVKTSFLVRYSYEWKSIVPTSERNTSAHPSRPFCAKLMQLDRLYSRSEIESISRRLGYSVFDRGGGWWNMGGGVNSPSCRHQWVSKVVIKKDK